MHTVFRNNGKKIIFAFELLILMVLFGCGSGKNNPPAITLSETNITVNARDYIMVTVNYEKGAKDIKELRVIGLGSEIIESLDKEASSYEFSGRVPLSLAATTAIATFTVVDVNENESSADLNMEVLTPFLNERIRAYAGNAQGPSASGWDLVNNESKIGPDSDSNKDIMDNTSGVTGDFLNGGWTTGTSTRFVVANEFDYDNANVEDVIMTYEAGTPKGFLTNTELAVDNVIIAKIRDTGEYAIIKITEVYDDGQNGGTGNNSDYRRFIYRKQ